jgi:TolA-binding protein
LRNYLEIGTRDEKFYEVKIWLGNHYFAQERYDSALSLFQEIMKEPTSGELHVEASQMIAQTYVRMGNPDKAEEWFHGQMKAGDSATSHDARERLAQALYVQAEKAEKENKLEEAAKYFGDVTRAFPNSEISPIALYNCTVLRERLQQWRKALAGYEKFTELYYNSPMLPRVLFRQAKTREKLGEWQLAAEGYWKLGMTYPNSEQGEPALYNAGFAFANAKLNAKAAQAFENYADKFPQATESPNLLFRAVEIQAELQQWDKVAELQQQFQRKYGNDRNRMVQAQCLGGLAAYHQKRWDAARTALQAAVDVFRSQGNRDPQSRVYAAQSQFTLAEMAAVEVDKQPLREASLDKDLDAKTRKLKWAASEYVKVVDYRIAEWALRSAHALGVLFEAYGREVQSVPVTLAKTPAQALEKMLQSTETMGAAWIEAADHYGQAVWIADQQKVKTRFSQEAEGKPLQLNLAFQKMADSLWNRFGRIWPISGLPNEKAVAEAMDRLAYQAVLATQVVQVSAGFEKTIQSLPKDSSQANADTVLTERFTGTDFSLRLLYLLGSKYQRLQDTVQSTALPSDSMEAFFFKAKLNLEGLTGIRKEGVQSFEAGLQIAEERRRDSSQWVDSLKTGLGKTLFLHAKACDLLAHKALAQPPIPFDAQPAMRKTFEGRFEEVGYQLQDEAMAQYKNLIARAKAGQVNALYAELALLRLFESEPDAWSVAVKADSAKGVATNDSVAKPLLPHQPWDNAEMSADRMAYLKTLQFTVPNLRP